MTGRYLRSNTSQAYTVFGVPPEYSIRVQFVFRVLFIIADWTIHGCGWDGRVGEKRPVEEVNMLTGRAVRR